MTGEHFNGHIAVGVDCCGFTGDCTMRACILFLVVMISTSFVCAQATQPAGKEPNWQPLFNGKDLTGWYTFFQKQGKNNDPDHLIQVHDGIIHIYKDAPAPTSQPFGYLCTDKEYGD